MSAREADRATVVEAFHARITADRAQGTLRPVSEYQNLFPGYWDLIRSEYRRAVPEAVPERAGTAANAPASPAPPTRGRPTDRIGPYLLLREFGRGGMGVVHEAIDTRLDRRVALKVLSPAVASSEALLRRFEREAGIASRLDHPAICMVFEAGEIGGVHFMAMQLVDGCSLAEEIKEAREQGDPRGIVTTASDHGRDSGSSSTAGARASLDELLGMFETIARALHVAHEKGLIHRDVKPGNIMLTPEGKPMLLDFGLAREVEDDESHDITRSGALLGTPAYMSPEQIAAQRIPLDRRTDIYSLAVTMYERLTLRLPHAAETREALYHQILTATPPDPRRLNPLLPADLAVVLLTALDKDRDRRYATAADLADDIARVRANEPILARPVGPLVRLDRWAQRNRALAGSLLGLFLALAAGLGVTAHLLGENRAALDDAHEAGARLQTATTLLTDARREAEQRRLRGEGAMERMRAEHRRLLGMLDATPVDGPTTLDLRDGARAVLTAGARVLRGRGAGESWRLQLVAGALDLEGGMHGLLGTPVLTVTARDPARPITGRVSVEDDGAVRVVLAPESGAARLLDPETGADIDLGPGGGVILARPDGSASLRVATLAGRAGTRPLTVELPLPGEHPARLTIPDGSVLVIARQPLTSTLVVHHAAGGTVPVQVSIAETLHEIPVTKNLILGRE